MEYSALLSSFSASLSGSSVHSHLLASHLRTSLAHLGVKNPELRAATARLTSELILSCDASSESALEVASEAPAVCKGLSGLLGGEMREASEVAASLLGKVLVHLRSLELAAEQ